MFKLVLKNKSKPSQTPLIDRVVETFDQLVWPAKINDLRRAARIEFRDLGCSIRCNYPVKPYQTHEYNRKGGQIDFVIFNENEEVAVEVDSHHPRQRSIQNLFGYQNGERVLLLRNNRSVKFKIGTIQVMGVDVRSTPR